MGYTYDGSGNVFQTETVNRDGTQALLVSSVFDNRNWLIETRAPHLSGKPITQRILDSNSNLIELLVPRNRNGAGFNHLKAEWSRLWGAGLAT